MAIDLAPKPPAIWGLLCTILAVPEPLAKRTWLALATCPWTEVQDWRRRLLTSEQIGDPEQLARSLFAPSQVCHVLELLHQAGRLRREEATRFQGCVLQWTDASGAWK